MIMVHLGSDRACCHVIVCSSIVSVLNTVCTVCLYRSLLSVKKTLKVHVKCNNTSALSL